MIQFTFNAFYNFYIRYEKIILEVKKLHFVFDINSLLLNKIRVKYCGHGLIQEKNNANANNK